MSLMTPGLMALIGVSFVTSVAFGQSATRDSAFERVAAVVAETMKDYGVHGAALGVVRTHGRSWT